MHPKQDEARNTAYRCLLEVLENQGYSNLVLKQELSGSSLNEKERSFATIYPFPCTSKEVACGSNSTVKSAYPLSPSLAPAKAAAELNEQMKDYTYVKSPWRWVCLAIIIGCILSLIFGGTIGLLVHLLNASVSSSIGIIGGADGPTAIFVTTSPDYIWYQTGITAIILIMAILGFYRLSRCPRK